MKIPLSCILIILVGCAEVGVTYSMCKEFEESLDQTFDEGLALGKQMAYDRVIRCARLGAPCKIKSSDEYEYTVTVKLEKQKVKDIEG